MKNILFAIAFMTMMVFNANAQRDGFFSDYDDSSVYEDRTGGSVPTLPYGTHVGGISGDQNAIAPLGSGLLILTALGAGYTVSKKKKKTF